MKFVRFSEYYRYWIWYLLNLNKINSSLRNVKLYFNAKNLGPCAVMKSMNNVYAQWRVTGWKKINMQLHGRTTTKAEMISPLIDCHHMHMWINKKWWRNFKNNFFFLIKLYRIFNNINQSINIRSFNNGDCLLQALDKIALELQNLRPFYVKSSEVP